MSTNPYFSEADHWIMAKLAVALRTELEPARATEMLKTFVYFRSKAQIYFREGPDTYRQEDFFHVPRAEWTRRDLDGMEHGFRQVIDWKGLIAARPLRGVPLSDLYRMIEVTHFRLEQLSVTAPEGDAQVVNLELRHRVDGRSLNLHFAIDRIKNAEPAAAVGLRPAWLQRWLLRFGRRTATPARSGPVDPTYGYTLDNPIVCFEPLGEFTYLQTLRCPNGHRFHGHRMGSLSGKCPDPAAHKDLVLPDGPDHAACIVDKYSLVCEGREHSCTLYFDMYHPLALAQPAPLGLTRSPADA